VEIWETKTREIVAIKIVRTKMQIVVAKTLKKADLREQVTRVQLRATREEIREAKPVTKVVQADQVILIAAVVNLARVLKEVNNNFTIHHFLKDLSCERSFSFLSHTQRIVYLKA
jgi:hypothetical protein